MSDSESGARAALGSRAGVQLGPSALFRRRLKRLALPQLPPLETPAAQCSDFYVRTPHGHES